MIKKFGMLMVLSALFGGIVLAGCSGGGEEETPANKVEKPADGEEK